MGSFLFVCFLFSGFTFGGFVTPAFRLMQYQYKEGEFGPQQASLSLQAIGFPQAISTSTLLSRRAVLIRAADVNASVIENLKDRSGGILLLLPHETSDTQLRNWIQTEKWLLKQQFKIPVYYIWETKEWNRVYENLADAPNFDNEYLTQLWPLLNSYQLEIEAPSILKLPTVNLPFVQAFLAGSGENVRTFAIVTHYDTFAAAPSLAFGVDENGSGMAAFLELVRIFSSLYHRSGSEGKYNLLFVLTSGARLNYEGTKIWLNELDSRLKESIEFVLCLDSIGTDDHLFFHISRISRDEQNVRFYEQMNRTANSYGISLSFVQKKIKLDDENVYWEHEQFSRQKVISGTLSGNPEPIAPFDRINSYDNNNSLKIEKLQRNVRFIAETLVHHLYNNYQIQDELISSLFQENESLLSIWMETFNIIPRMSGYLKDTEPLFNSIHEFLKQHCTNVVVENKQIKYSPGI
jgi:hypothetical protein